MKQSEVNKALTTAFKAAVAPTAWKHIAGFLYCRKEKLFFSLIILGNGKSGSIRYTLDYKYFEFDDLFWQIVQLQENARRPLSFRAQGAWVFPSFCIKEGEIPISTWDTEHLMRVVEEVLSEADTLSSEYAERIRTPDQNLAELERLLAGLLKQHPGALVDINRERMMTAILKRDISTARQIARDRISQGDHGGFSMGSRSFFHLSAEFLARLPAAPGGTPSD